MIPGSGKKWCPVLSCDSSDLYDDDTLFERERVLCALVPIVNVGMYGAACFFAIYCVEPCYSQHILRKCHITFDVISGSALPKARAQKLVEVGFRCLTFHHLEKKTGYLGVATQ